MRLQHLHHSTVGNCHLPEKYENEAGCNVSIVPAGGVGPGYGGAAGGGLTGERDSHLPTFNILPFSIL